MDYKIYNIKKNISIMLYEILNINYLNEMINIFYNVLFKTRERIVGDNDLEEI